MNGLGAVFDGHVHVNRFDLMRPECRALIQENPTYPLMAQCVEDPAQLLEIMDAEAIDRLCMINYCARDIMGYGWEVNEWAAEYVDAAPARLCTTGGYDPRHDGDGEEAVVRLLDLGVVACKIHPVHQDLAPDDDRMAPFYVAAAERGLPVIFHTGTSVFPGARNEHQHIAPMARVAAAHPNLTIVLAHAGRPGECDAAWRMMQDHDNVLLDLSSMPPKRIPEWFPELGSHAERFLWGSDWPGPKVPGMGENVRRFRALGLGEDVERAVLWGNLVRLYG